ncbi:MAG: primosomal protein N' [Candidatus Poribacteria bacterium]|nr:primosomal protein N' [Candidatus Poribacteria bacterium]
MSSDSARYVEVAFPVPVRRTFTYRVPDDLADSAMPGVRVLASFGRQTLDGVIVADAGTPDLPPARIKPLIDALDEEPFFSPELLDLCHWTADYYLCSWGEALQAAVPGGSRMLHRRRVSLTEEGASVDTRELKSHTPIQARLLNALRHRNGQTVEQLRKAMPKSAVYAPLAALESRGWVAVEQEVSGGVSTKTVQVARLTKPPVEIADLAKRLRKRAPKQVAILEHLCRVTDDVPVRQLLREAQTTYGTVKALEAKELIVVHEEEELRSALNDELEGLAFSSDPLLLNDEQRDAFSPIANAIDAERHETTVLYGVTGSGKTEVYMQAIQRAINLKRGVICLIPEIALTPQTMRRFVSRFGMRVAVMHSRLSAGERYDEWRRVRRGDADIVVGPRSAVFAPVERLGLVIIDEEHETTYKQEEPSPRYHAREVAEYRARQANAPLVLGSATPSLESMWRVEAGRYRLARLKRRVMDIALPEVHTIDMREELRKENRSIFSQKLRDAIQNRLDNDEQTIMFLNRRGFSSYVFCRDCGQAAKCPDCVIGMTYHKRQDILICHHCGRVNRPPQVCPKCGSHRIRQMGLGTQQVEELSRQEFRNARIARMDADTTTRKGSHEAILGRFRDGDLDILIGTQMIAKGLDFPNVTLVGVILAETSLYLPDFRASERSFNLLTQVAGRSGRSERGGEVIFQTYQPDHYSIVTAQRHDYDAFCAHEFPERKLYGYPPYAHACRYLIRGEHEKDVIDAAHLIKRTLEPLIESGDGEDVTLKGPAATPMARIRGQYRWHLLLCCESPKRLQSLGKRTLDETAAKFRRGDVTLTVDMDPMNLL